MTNALLRVLLKLRLITGTATEFDAFLIVERLLNDESLSQRCVALAMPSAAFESVFGKSTAESATCAATLETVLPTLTRQELFELKQRF